MLMKHKGGLQGCDVIIVYPDRALAESKLAPSLSRALHARICVTNSIRDVEANYKPLVYPVIVFSASIGKRFAIMGYAKPLANKYYVLNPYLSARLALSSGIKPIYTHHSRVVIEYYGKFKQLLNNLNMSLLTKALSLILLSNVDEVKVTFTSNTSQPLPYIIVYTDLNLTNMVRSVKRVGSAYLISDARSISQLLSSIENRGIPYIVRFKPASKDYLMAFGPLKAPIKVYVYIDLECPYSAKYFTTVLPKLLMEAKKGVIRLVVKSMIVHSDPELPLMHDAIACYATSEGSMKAFNLTLKIFHLVLEGKKPTLALLSNFTGLNATLLASKCHGLAEESTNEARQLHIPGTPSTVVYYSKDHISAVLVGVVPFRDVEQLIRLGVGS